MATKIGSLILEMRANTTKFIQGISKSKKSVGNLNKGIGKLKGSLFALAGAGGFALVIKRSVDAADAIGKNSAAIGLTAEAYQELAHAADIAGTDLSSFTSNMTAFVKRVGDARNGVGPLVSGLRQFNGELLENLKNSRDQEQALDILADAIHNASDAADRASLANAAFGRSGVHMSNLLKGGAKGIDEVTKRARELGLVISNESIANAELLKDKMTELGKVLTTKVTQAIVDNAKSFETLATALLNAAVEAGKFFDSLTPADAGSSIDKIVGKIQVESNRLIKINENIKEQESVVDRILESSARTFFFASKLERIDEELLELHNERAIKLREILALQKLISDQGVEQAETARKASEDATKFGPEGNAPSLGKTSSADDERIATKLENLRKSLLTENELLTENYITQLGIVESADAALVGTRQEREDLITAIEKQASDKRIELTKNEEDKKRALLNDKFNTAKNIAGRLSSLAKTEGGKETQRSRTLAKIGIGISTAQAIMNALAVTPFPLGLGMAAIAAAEGAKQLSKVGGGGGGGSVASASSVSAIDLTPLDPVTSGPAGAQSATQIIFTGDMLGEDLSERLVDIIKSATNDRDIVIFNGDSRQAQEIRETT